MEARVLSEFCAAIEAGESVWALLGGRERSVEFDEVKRDHLEQIKTSMRRRLINNLVKIGWTDKDFELWQLR